MYYFCARFLGYFIAFFINLPMSIALRPLFVSYRAELTDTVRLSVPIIIAQLGVVLMGVTDNLFVGRLLGAVPLGAAGLANSLSFLMSSIGVGGLTVVAALVSKAYNQQRPGCR